MAIGSSNPPSGAQPLVRGSVLAALTVATAFLWADQAISSKGEDSVDAAESDGVNPYSKLSNEELGTLTRTFEELDRDQRRWFLTEVRKRMSAKGNRPRIEVGKDDRFGQVGRDEGDEESTRSMPDAKGVAPTGDDGETPKVYGSGLPSRPKETADGTLPPAQSEDPSKPVE